jgi:hypothetical protein
VARGLTDAQMVERLERLERSVAKIANAVGVEIENPAARIDPQVAELARAGKQMEAARLHAEQTGVDFVEAQRVVSEL